LGAFTRGREIKTADDLLTLNLLYMTQGESFQMTSAMMKLTENISVNKNAVYKRIKGSWRWLQWMAQNICKENGYMAEKPTWLEDKNVCLIDASDMALKGSKSSDYRLHYMFDLFNFTCRSMEITTIKEGEKLDRYQVGKDDILIADRIYGTIKGIEYAKANESDFILRLKSKAFIIYDKEGNKIDIMSQIRHLKEWQSTSIDCFYKCDNELKSIRICAMKKDKKACEQAKRNMQKKVSRKQEEVVSAETIELNEYIIVATSLIYTNEQIFELYRSRWQIEMVFNRLKTLFGFGEIPSKNEDSVKAWFYGKLFLAALSEAMVKESHFSPMQKI